jgi:hypothetical protein
MIVPLRRDITTEPLIYRRFASKKELLDDFRSDCKMVRDGTPPTSAPAPPTVSCSSHRSCACMRAVCACVCVCVCVCVATLQR